ncbi:MAG: hypothetical protein ABFD76_08125 [Smithella sp.]
MIKTKRAYGLGSSTLSIVIPTELLLELNHLAGISGTSRNKLIKNAVEDLLNRERRSKTKLDKEFIIHEQILNAHPDQ